MRLNESCYARSVREPLQALAVARFKNNAPMPGTKSSQMIVIASADAADLKHGSSMKSQKTCTSVRPVAFGKFGTIVKRRDSGRDVWQLMREGSSCLHMACLGWNEGDDHAPHLLEFLVPFMQGLYILRDGVRGCHPPPPTPLSDLRSSAG